MDLVRSASERDTHESVVGFVDHFANSLTDAVYEWYEYEGMHP
jgi:hypothetical protein